MRTRHGHPAAGRVQVPAARRRDGCVSRDAWARASRRVVGALFLVLLDAAVELVGQQVDGGVHVFFGGVGVDRVAADVQRRLGLLSQLLHRQHTVHVDDLVEMPCRCVRVSSPRKPRSDGVTSTW